MPDVSRKRPKIAIRRAYEAPSSDDGYRVLVDRLWPRGLSKTALKLDEWARELAPSTGLREWFGHDPQRWEMFQQRYRSELAAEDRQQQMRRLLADADGRPMTLVYGAKDEAHNQAVVLREVMSELHHG